MSKNESVQKRLQRVRAPRIQMTYDVEIGDVIEQKELPFVVGVVGDFGSDPAHPGKRLKDRQFVQVDRDNLDEVMAGISPSATFRVPNRLSPEGGQFSVDLQFRKMADFRPEAVVAQVAPLKGLLEARAKLADLRNKLTGNDKLDDLLRDVLSNTDQLRQLGRKPDGNGEA